MFCQIIRHNWVTELILILNLPSSLSVASWIKSLPCLNTSSQIYRPTVQQAEWAWIKFSGTVISNSLRPPWTTARQALLSITIFQSLLKLTSIKSVMPSNHLIFSYFFLFLPSIFPSIRVFSNESVLCIRWPQYWNFSFSISPSNEYSGLIIFRTGLISLQSKGLLRVFSNTKVQKHQFFGTQFSSWSNSHIHS